MEVSKYLISGWRASHIVKQPHKPDKLNVIKATINLPSLDQSAKRKMKADNTFRIKKDSFFFFGKALFYIQYTKYNFLLKHKQCFKNSFELSVSLRFHQIVFFRYTDFKFLLVSQTRVIMKKTYILWHKKAEK